MAESFWYGLAIEVLLLALFHWAPWPRRLPRIVAYVIGVGALLVGAAVWLLPLGQCQIVAGLTLLAVAGGLAIAACWGIDWLLNLNARYEAERERNN